MLAAEHVERSVDRRHPHPSGRLLLAVGEAAMGRQENLLRHVLRGLKVPYDAIGEAHDRSVVLTEKPFEAGRRGVPALAFGIALAPCVHLHHLLSTAAAPNVTNRQPLTRRSCEGRCFDQRKSTNQREVRTS